MFFGFIPLGPARTHSDPWWLAVLATHIPATRKKSRFAEKSRLRRKKTLPPGATIVAIVAIEGIVVVGDYLKRQVMVPVPLVVRLVGTEKRLLSDSRSQLARTSACFHASPVPLTAFASITLPRAFTVTITVIEH